MVGGSSKILYHSYCNTLIFCKDSHFFLFVFINFFYLFYKKYK